VIPIMTDCGWSSAQPRSAFAMLLLNEIAQVLELDSEVDIVNHDVFGHVQNYGREIENAHHPGLDQSVRDFLSFRRRHSYDCHFDMVGLDKIGKFLHAKDWEVNFFVAPPFGLDIERSDDFKTFLFKSAIRKERQTEITDADKNHRLQTVGAELIRNHLGQRGDVVAQAARAELAEVSKILSELSGLNARDFRERFARNSLNIVILQSSKATQVEREPVNGLSRNGRAVSFLQPTQDG